MPLSPPFSHVLIICAAEKLTATSQLALHLSLCKWMGVFSSLSLSFSLSLFFSVRTGAYLLVLLTLSSLDRIATKKFAYSIPPHYKEGMPVRIKVEEEKGKNEKARNDLHLTHRTQAHTADMSYV